VLLDLSLGCLFYSDAATITHVQKPRPNRSPLTRRGIFELRTLWLKPVNSFEVPTDTSIALPPEIDMLDRPSSSSSSSRSWLQLTVLVPIALTFILVALGSEVLYLYSHANQGVIPLLHTILLVFTVFTSLHYAGFHIDLFNESESRVLQFLKVSAQSPDNRNLY